MASQQELQVQRKREVEKKQETTTPLRGFLPTTDIFETDQALTVIFEMPGVSKESVDVSVKNDILTIEGRIDFRSMKVFCQFTPNTISAITRGVFRFRAKSTKTRLAPR